MTSMKLDHNADAAVSRSGRRTAMVWLCAASAIAYLQRNCLGIAESTLRENFGFDKEQMGWVLGGFFWTYAFFQIPSGWLADRWGSKKTLTLYCAFWSLATGLLIFAGTMFTDMFSSVAANFGIPLFGALAWLIAMRLFAGAAQAGVFPCSAKVIAERVPDSNRAVATAWLGAFQQVGFVIALIATGPLMEKVGWRMMLLIYSVPGIIWAVWFSRSFRESPTVSEKPQSSTGEPERGRLPWRTLFRSRAMWCICGQQFCRAAGYIFYASWFPTFLQETHGVTVSKSGYLTAMTIVAALFGSLLGGTVSDKILAVTGNRRLARQGVAIVGMFLCAMFIFIAYFVDDPVLAVSIISLGSFCASLAGPSGYTVTIEMGGPHVATVFAMMNMAGNIGAAIFPIMVPYLLKLPGGWNSVLFVFGGLYLAAMVFWILLKSEGTVFDSSEKSVAT